MPSKNLQLNLPEGAIALLGALTNAVIADEAQMVLANQDAVLTQLASPLNVAVAFTGTAASTTYTYVVAAVSVNGVAPATGVSVTTGAATLNSTNFNTITWAPVAGALGYNVYRSAGGAAQGIIATLGSSVLSLVDNGLTATSGTNIPTANTTGQLSLSAPIISTALMFEGPLPSTNTQTTGQTLTIANMLTPLLVRTGPTAAFNDTTPTAAALVAAIPGIKAGSSYVWMYRNGATSSGTSTLLAGTGVTLATGNTNTTAIANTHTWLVVFTNVTPGSEAVTIYSLGSSLVH